MPTLPGYNESTSVSLQRLYLLRLSLRVTDSKPRAKRNGVIARVLSEAIPLPCLETSSWAQSNDCFSRSSFAMTTFFLRSLSSSPSMGEVRWGWKKKDDHPPFVLPIKGGIIRILVAAEGIITLLRKETSVSNLYHGQTLSCYPGHKNYLNESHANQL